MSFLVSGAGTTIDFEFTIATRCGSANLRSVWGAWCSSAYDCFFILLDCFLGLVISVPASRSSVRDMLAFLRMCCFLGMPMLCWTGIVRFDVDTR